MQQILSQIQIPRVLLVGTVLLLLAALFIRRVLPPEHRMHGRASVYFLLVSLLLSLGAVAAQATAQTGLGSWLDALGVLLLACGIAGVAGMVLFDIALLRLGVNVPNMVRDLVQAAAFAFILLGVLRRSGVNLWSLITTSAVLTAIVGLALQSTIANLFAGISLQIDRTINIGDWVQVGTRVGKITLIKWRSTFMVTRDGDNVILPNSELLKGEVLNFSKPTGTHRVWIKVGFAYRHPPNDVRRMLAEVTRGVPGVVAEPPPDAVITNLGESAVEYAVRFWITDIENEASIDSEVRARIWYRAQRDGLELPYPTRNVLMTEVTQERLDRAEERDFQERVDAVARLDLFAPLAGTGRELLARSIRRVDFGRGEQIIRQGEPGDSLYVIRGGEVAVRLEAAGVEREVAVLKKGEFFGEMSLLTGAPRTANCVARADVSCYLVDHRALQRVFEQSPRIAEDMSTILARRQILLEGERNNLSAEASARAAETSSDILGRIRDFFHLG